MAIAVQMAPSVRRFSLFQQWCLGLLTLAFVAAGGVTVAIFGLRDAQQSFET
jgi:hypothetical protein